MHFWVNQKSYRLPVSQIFLNYMYHRITTKFENMFYHLDKKEKDLRSVS